MLGKHGRRSRWSTGSSAAARPSRFAAAGTSPRANARLPADASRRAPVLADRAAAIVERPELREVRPGLLEVVAEDLLELGAAVAVDAVGPDDEALVEIRPAPA